MNTGISKLIKSLFILTLPLALLYGCGQAAPTAVPASTPMPVSSPEQNTQPRPEATPLPSPEPTPTPTPTPEPVAEHISDGVKVCLNRVDLSDILSDENHYTRRYFLSHELLSVESEKPFSSLYIEWGYTPEEYTLHWEGGSLLCGQEGFQHDYIQLPEPVSCVEFTFADDSANTICDIELYTAGRAPEGVQNWLSPCDYADILVFPTHSDDDVLFFGPLISYYILERGLNVQTAFMVEHSEYPERAHERLDGLWEMGVRHYPVLGTAPDSDTWNFNEAMHFYEPYDITGWQVEQLRRFRPLAVVGHDLEGEYGNGGHKVNAHCLTQAVEAAASAEQYPDSALLYGTWDTPKLYLHLYEENQIVLDVNTPLENDAAGRSPFQIAQDAFLHHASQQKWAFKVAQEDKPEYDCRLFGLYRSLVGSDSGADIMENIDAGCRS